MKFKLIIVALMVIRVTSGFGADVQLVKDGKASGKIILQEKASPSEKLAAQELATYIKKISGATIATQNKITADSIVLGTLDNLKNLPAQVISRLKKDKSNDCFYLKTIDSKVYIVGKKPIGTLYGAYTLLEKLGVRWFYPGDLGENCPFCKNIVFNDIDNFQSPSMSYRFALLCATTGDFRDSNLWAARQKMRTYKRPSRWYRGWSKERGDFMATACAFINEQGGHAIFRQAVPDSLIESHPEYFCLKDGKRQYGNRLQRCVSNHKVMDLVVDYAVKWCKAHPENIFTFCGADKVDSWCECDKCKKMGTINGQYKVSNIYHRFVSKAVERICKQVPDAKIRIFFYINYSEVPDDASIKYTGKNIIGIYCTCWPHKRCYAHTITDKNCRMNIDSLAETKKVLAICPQTVTYEYLNCSKSQYAPVYRTIAQDIKSLAKIGIDGFMLESVAVNGKLLKRYNTPSSKYFWESTWLTHYLAGKLQWNNKLDVDKVISEAYHLFYGKAATTMIKYHKLREKLWNNVPGHAYYGGPQLTSFCLTVPGAEKQLRAYLAQAEKEAGGNTKIEKRIAQDKYFLDIFWKAPAEKLKKRFFQSKQLLPLKVSGKININGRLSEKEWITAQPIANFLTFDTHLPVLAKSNVRILYDKDNIYVGFVVMNDKAWGPVVTEASVKKTNRLWNDDHIELQLAAPNNNKVYYHLALNAKGFFYDSKIESGSTDTGYDSQTQYKVRKYKDRYVYELKIPIAPMRGSTDPGKNWRFYACRVASNLQPPDSSEASSLEGIRPHNHYEFPIMTIGNNFIRNNNFAQMGECKKKDGSKYKFPKHWAPAGLAVKEHKIEKTLSGNTIWYNGVIFTGFSAKRYKTGNYNLIVTAKGKGEISVRTWSWQGNRPRTKHRRLELAKYKLSDEFQEYTFSCKVIPNERHIIFYIYGKNIKVNNVSCMIRDDKK